MIYIPDRLKVGYDERDDTYTGKLAYVIYYDNKGKLRKESSWENWRDHSIEPDEFDNIPTDGFVLNKKVGDYVSDWNHRQAYCRVYDPRGFEIEITIENLLYIFENVNSYKGKGLDGKFVYGWSGKDLVLLPIDSPDYRMITNISKKSESPLKAKDYVVGYTYKTVDGNEYVFLGRNYRYSYDTEIESDDDCCTWDTEQTTFKRNVIHKSSSKCFWFASLYRWGGWSYSCCASAPKKIIECSDSTQHKDYEEMIQGLPFYAEYSPIDFSKCVERVATKDERAKIDYITLCKYADGTQVEDRRHSHGWGYYVKEGYYVNGSYYCSYDDKHKLEDALRKKDILVYDVYLENGNLFGVMMHPDRFKNGQVWLFDKYFDGGVEYKRNQKFLDNTIS